MARPDAGPPPVARSAVVQSQERQRERKDIVVYREIRDMFQREDRRADLRAMLGSDELVERFLAVALNAIATNSDLLLNASAISIVQAVRDSATLGLEPTGLTGEAVIIRYKEVATLRPMWRGYLKRIRNSGDVRDIDTQLVYTNDLFEYGYSDKGGWFRHMPVKPVKQKNEDGTWSYTAERGDYWGAYAYAVMPSGFVELEVMNDDQINEIRNRYSEGYKQGSENNPWRTSWGEMARKTVLNRLAKRLPQAAQALVAADEAADRLAEAERTARAEGPRLVTVGARNAALAAVGAPLPAGPAPAAESATEEPESKPAEQGVQPTLPVEREPIDASEPVERGVPPEPPPFPPDFG